MEAADRNVRIYALAVAKSSVQLHAPILVKIRAKDNAKIHVQMFVLDNVKLAVLPVVFPLVRETVLENVRVHVQVTAKMIALVAVHLAKATVFQRAQMHVPLVLTPAQHHALEGAPILVRDARQHVLVNVQDAPQLVSKLAMYHAPVVVHHAHHVLVVQEHVLETVTPVVIRRVLVDVERNVLEVA